MNPNARGSFLMLVIALVVICVGYLALNVTVNSIDGTSAANNLAAVNSNTVFSIYPPLLMIIGIVAFFVIVSYYISSPNRYLKTHKFLAKIFEFLDATTYYFAFGLMFFAICSVIGVAIYLLITALSVAGESGAGIEIGKWILIAVAFYFGTAGVGYLFKKSIWDKWKKTKTQALYQENMKELPGAI